MQSVWTEADSWSVAEHDFDLAESSDFATVCVSRRRIYMIVFFGLVMKIDIMRYMELGSHRRFVHIYIANVEPLSAIP